MAQEDKVEEEIETGVDIYNSYEARSLINIVPEKLRDCILKVKQKHLKMSEYELSEEVDMEDPLVLRLRKAFWREYENCQAQKRDFNVHAVSALLNMPTHLLWPHLKDPSKMAWILCPPTDYRFGLEEALDVGLNKLRQIVSLPVVGKNGRIDHKAAKLVMEAHKLIEARVFGAVVTKNLHMHAHEHSKANLDSTMSDDELDREIQKLEEREARERALKHLSEEAVEVESVRVTDKT